MTIHDRLNTAREIWWEWKISMTTEIGVSILVTAMSGIRGCQPAGLLIATDTGSGLIRGVGPGSMRVLGDMPPSTSAVGLLWEGDGAGFLGHVKKGRCTLLL